MSYLKALGVSRLVSEQKDSNARCHWRDGEFWLRTSLDEQGLVDFFVNEYRPTPIVVPWSGGDFFNVDRKANTSQFRKTPTSSKVIESFLASRTPRL
ncbi:MAG: hypothetical protein HY897_06525, partial [Deltaproteobacteria bacterium]|nr:hypothetical protein [Deltaproteobacteria bacterium]